METFFTKDKNFYKVFFRLMLVVALQNLVAYSVNMLDNMMLGSYDQNALSGAATVNQIFFVVNQLAIAIGNALIVMSSQYWGKKRYICDQETDRNCTDIQSAGSDDHPCHMLGIFGTIAWPVHNITGYYYGRSDLS